MYFCYTLLFYIRRTRFTSIAKVKEIIEAVEIATVVHYFVFLRCKVTAFLSFCQEKDRFFYFFVAKKYYGVIEGLSAFICLH